VILITKGTSNWMIVSIMQVTYMMKHVINNINSTRIFCCWRRNSWWQSKCNSVCNLQLLDVQLPKMALFHS
jgi:hypothetical protein